MVEQCRLLSVCFKSALQEEGGEGSPSPPSVGEHGMALRRPRGSQAETSTDNLQGCHCGNALCQTDSEKVG